MSVTPIPGGLRRAVMELHGSRCLACGVQCTPEWWGPQGVHIDHVIPELMGGPTVLENLQVLCRTCNLSKGATVADYRVHGERLPLGWSGQYGAHDYFPIPGRQEHPAEPRRVPAASSLDLPVSPHQVELLRLVDEHLASNPPVTVAEVAPYRPPMPVPRQESKREGKPVSVVLLRWWLCIIGVLTTLLILILLTAPNPMGPIFLALAMGVVVAGIPALVGYLVKQALFPKAKQQAINR
jgi:hypothetical protein